MKSLKNLLAKKFPEKKVARKTVLDDQTAFYIFREVAKEEFGNVGLEKFVPDYFSNGTVFIKCESSAWASELWLNKGKIVRKMNEKLGNDSFKAVKLKK